MGVRVFEALIDHPKFIDRVKYTSTRLIDENVTVAGLVPPGHKVATRAIKAGTPVRRYNQIIGFASKDIAPGERRKRLRQVLGPMMASSQVPTEWPDGQPLLRPPAHPRGPRRLSPRFRRSASSTSCRASE